MAAASTVGIGAGKPGRLRGRRCADRTVLSLVSLYTPGIPGRYSGGMEPQTMTLSASALAAPLVSKVARSLIRLVRREHASILASRERRRWVEERATVGTTS